MKGLPLNSEVEPVKLQVAAVSGKARASRSRALIGVYRV